MPSLVVFAVVSILSTVFMVLVSLTRYNLAVSPELTFGGALNYELFLSDPIAHQTLLLLLGLLIISVPIEMAIGMGVALLLRVDLPGFRASLAIFLLPLLIPPVIVGVIWRALLTPGTGGVGYFLHALGLPEIAWLARPHLAQISVLAVSIWQYFAFSTLFFLGALDAIPEEYTEAALVDGAGAWRRFRLITIPLLKPAIATTAIYEIVNALNIFPVIYAMTNGGPGNSTKPFNFYIFEQLFVYYNISYGAALAVIYLLMMLILSFVLVRWTLKWLSPEVYH